MQARSPSRRWIWWVLGIIGLLVVIFAALTARLFLWPPSDQPSKANAVVALGGDPEQQRIASALKLAEEGYAPVAVLSLGGDPTVLCPSAPKGIKVICFRPNPVNTRGEAEFMAKLAAQRHWDRIIVVPSRTQTTRARLVFKRCTNATLEMIPVADRPSQVIGDIFYQWGALLKALALERSC